jgi:hypothetical protein
MGDPSKSQPGRNRRLILAALLGLGLALGAVAYQYADDLMSLASSLTSGKMGHAQSRIHY